MRLRLVRNDSFLSFATVSAFLFAFFTGVRKFFSCLRVGEDGSCDALSISRSGGNVKEGAAALFFFISFVGYIVVKGL